MDGGEPRVRLASMAGGRGKGLGGIVDAGHRSVLGCETCMDYRPPCHGTGSVYFFAEYSKSWNFYPLLSSNLTKGIFLYPEMLKFLNRKGGIM